MPAFARVFRAAAVALFALAVAMPVARASEPSPDAAASFIRELGEQAIADLGDESVPMAERVQRFRELVNKGFAMETIGRFVLGRYARVASEPQMAEFRKVFLGVVTQRFLPLFEDYTTADFHVDGAKRDPRRDNLFLVQSRVRSPKNDQFAQAGWRVQYKDGRYRIVDVVAEGVSMAITLRSEYSSVIQQNGGRVDALIAKLRQRVKAGEIEANTAMTESGG